MAYDLTDELEHRLRASRPDAAHVDENAFDPELLRRVRDQPIDARRRAPRSVLVPVAAGATLTAAAVLALGGGPGDVAGPSPASAITQALHWLNPPPGTVLHVRSVETMGTQTTTRELWQSADHPSSERQLIDGAHSYETSSDGLYDPATNTIYDATPASTKGGPEPGPAPVGDAIVAKVRYLLQQGRMTVTGPVLHDGVNCWAISLNPDYGRPVWTLWVSAADGKPIELRDPGRDASAQPQVIRWPTYEVLPGAGADQQLTLRGAHPSATVDHSARDAAQAEQRLQPAP